MELVRKYFPNFHSLHDLRVQLLEAIDKTHTTRLDRGASVLSTSRVPVDEIVSMSKHVPQFSTTPRLNDNENPIGRKPVLIFTPKKRISTPQVILDILKQVEKKQPVKVDKKHEEEKRKLQQMNENMFHGRVLPKEFDKTINAVMGSH
jgi:hypothetical protein